jgi:hypothetical protein
MSVRPIWWMGPQLRDRAQIATPTQGIDAAWVQYEYVDANGRRAPEYEAGFIRLRVFYAFTGHPLEPAAAALATIPGFVRAEQVTGHRTLRNQVVATFARRAEEATP